VLDLNVGTHVFTFHAEDNYGEHASTTISIQVDNEPPAATPQIEIVHEDLRYVTVDVRESQYTPSEDGNTIWGGPAEGGSEDAFDDRLMIILKLNMMVIPGILLSLTYIVMVNISILGMM